MKYCPVCERRYDEEMRVCGVDGTPLQPQGGGDSQQDPLAGRSIKGRYQVLGTLGEGGMGTVYLAEQVSMGRKVALKLLRGNYARDNEFIARFRREARLAASLNHRNIVMIHDFDQDSDGTLFIAMEFIDGVKLSDIIRRQGPLPIDRVIRLGSQIAEGLAAAHGAGVIHRDIKPDNIMVTGRSGAEEVKLMDFGIARLRDAGTMSQLTQTGMIMGTPAYMAPEQAEGSLVSERTDIYALGIVLYEMLSGSVPFKASTPAAVLIKQIQEIPQPLRALRGEVPEGIERVVMQALEKAPEKRQRSMNEIADGLRLQAVSAATERVTPTVAATPQAPLSPLEQRPKYAESPTSQLVDQAPATIAATSVIRETVVEKRNRARLKLAGIAVASLVLLAGIGFALWRSRGPAPEPQPVQIGRQTTDAPSAPAGPQVANPPPQTDGGSAEMVAVPAGEFWMGSDADDSDEKPRRRVHLDAFGIDQFEVSNTLYRRFMDATGRAAPRFWNDSKWNQPNQPVVGVDWNDARAYCTWAGKRLPTEAEWEKAARGTDGRRYPWGEQWDVNRANSAQSKLGKTVAVGSYPGGVSPYGAHDMAGNVWEWVADWYDANYYQSATGRNPRGPNSGQARVRRGGAWILNPGDLRTSNRDNFVPTDRNDLIGFRCAQ